jgi:DNA-directed RNA polymerase sigma subunit (sigma70/sigma32)
VQEARVARNQVVVDSDSGRQVISPPEALNRKLWPDWQRMVSFSLAHPESWSAFKKNHPRRYLILAVHLQLDDFRGKNTTLSDLAREWGLTRERVRQLKASALRIILRLEQDH